MTSWIDEELKGSKFSDKRLKTRFSQLVTQLAGKVGESLPTACRDWANVKAAYRFFSNQNLTEGEILAGHFLSTRERFTATQGTILVLHDTTEITYNRSQPAKIGFTRKCANKKGLFHQQVKRAMCGILMHSSLVLTTEGLPLGFSTKKFWSRDKFKGAGALYRKRMPRESPLKKRKVIAGLKALRDLTTYWETPVE